MNRLNHVAIIMDGNGRWGLKQKNRSLEIVREIGNCPDRLVSFGKDNENNLYAVGYDKGIVYKIDFSGSVFE